MKCSPNNIVHLLVHLVKIKTVYFVYVPSYWGALILNSSAGGAPPIPGPLTHPSPPPAPLCYVNGPGIGGTRHRQRVHVNIGGGELSRAGGFV